MRKGLLFHLAVKTKVFEPVKRTYLYLEHLIWVNMPQIKLLLIVARKIILCLVGRVSHTRGFLNLGSTLSLINSCIHCRTRLANGLYSHTTQDNRSAGYIIWNPDSYSGIKCILILYRNWSFSTFLKQINLLVNNQLSLNM